MTKPSFAIEAFGERGFLARLGGFADNVASGLFANAVAETLRARAGVADAVAGVDSIALRYDPDRMSDEAARAMLSRAIEKTPQTRKAARDSIDIPVCYGGALGPDFEDIRARANVSAEALIEAHSAPAYRVITLGFAPGFAYLGGLDPRLAAPRLATPRPRVEAGSIGVAGAMSGVYALASPGGWRIIGRTPLTLFRRDSARPFALAPGDQVRFRPISESEFEKIHAESQ